MNDQKEKEIPRKPLAFIVEMSRSNRHVAFFAMTLTFFATLFDTSTPYIYKRIVDAATTVSETGSPDYTAIWFWVIVYIAVIALMYGSWRATSFVGMHWVTGTSKAAYNELFRYLSKHSHSYFSDRFAGALTNKVSNAADGAGRLTEMFLFNYFSNSLSFIITGFFLFTTSVAVGFIFVAMVVILFAFGFFMMRFQRPRVITYMKENSILRGQAVDVATNITAVQHFARRKHELSRIEDQVEKTRAADVSRWQLSEFSFLINNVIIVVAIAAMLFVMVNLYQVGKVTLGDFVLVITLMSSMLGLLTVIGRIMNNFVKMHGQVEEGLSEIIVDHEVVDTDGAKDLEAHDGEVVFKDVSFSYGESKVFANLNLVLRGGEKVGIVGHSGAGKSTLVSMLLRQHDIEGGGILIDGQDIKEVTQDSLRDAISIVPQEPMLFHRTIEENIRYGDLDATDEQVREAAVNAQAHDFILEAPQGYETYVGERGIKLSGGQRQRIAVARAMVKNAPILILDEATSSLDSESENLIQKALHILMEGKTVIAIAHRLSTLREMDRIIVFEGGEIVQDGTHDELLEEKGSLYEKLWNHQADGFIE